MFRIALIATLVLFVSRGYCTADDKASDLEKLQGRWELTGADDSDGLAKKEGFAKYTLVIKDDQMAREMHGKMGEFRPFKIHPDTAHKQIDFKSGGQEDLDRFGVYSIDGDTLRICFSTVVPAEASRRPSDFTTKPGSGRVLFVFKRDEEESTAKAQERASVEGTKAKIRKLQQERVILLQKAGEVALAHYREGELDFRTVKTAQQDLLEAKLEIAETREEQSQLLTSQLEIANGSLAVAEAMYQAAETTVLDVHQAKSAVLFIKTKLLTLRNGRENEIPEAVKPSEEAEHPSPQAAPDGVRRVKVQLELLEDTESLIIRGEKEDVKKIGDLLGQLGRDRLEPTRGAESDQARAAEPTADVNQAKSLSRTCQHVAQAIVPSVVRVDKDNSSGNRQPDNPSGVKPVGRSSGAGVIIEHSPAAKSAIILTSYSIVRDATGVTVTTGDGREFAGVDVKGDAATDVAIVRVTGIEQAQVALFGDSNELELGQLVLAVGHPFGLAGSVSMGIISGLGRQLPATQRATMIQTDAAANAGSAGGPLVNLDDKVVGIVSAIASQSSGFDGVTFAIPINHARSIAQKLIKHGRVPRGRLGVAILDLTPALRAELNSPIAGGVLVGKVLEELPAAKAGIQSGDIIVELAGSKVSRPVDLQMTVDRTPIGTKQELKLIRDGKEMSVTVVLEEMGR